MREEKKYQILPAKKLNKSKLNNLHKYLNYFFQ